MWKPGPSAHFHSDRVANLPLTSLAGALRPVFPEWSGQLPPAPEPLPDASAARHRMLRALVDLIDALGVETGRP